MPPTGHRRRADRISRDADVLRSQNATFGRVLRSPTAGCVRHRGEVLQLFARRVPVGRRIDLRHAILLRSCDDVDDNEDDGGQGRSIDRAGNGLQRWTIVPMLRYGRRHVDEVDDRRVWWKQR